jgi:hypothetical protein
MLLALCVAGIILIVTDFLPFLVKVCMVPACLCITSLCVLPMVIITLAEFDNPPAPYPAAMNKRHPMPTDNPVAEKHQQLIQWVRRTIEQGYNPDHIWPRENEQRFHRLMMDGDVEEAMQLLEDALEKTAEHGTIPSGSMQRTQSTSEGENNALQETGRK